jgi:hypothetical protein
MSEQLNWYIVPSDDSVTTVLPGSTDAYDLFNETILQRVAYGSREYGICLV